MRSPGRRARRWITALVLLGVVVLAGLWALTRLLAARDELEAARAHLTAARTALLDRDLDAAAAAVDQARARTSRARLLTDDPVVRLVSHVPFAGRSAEVVRGVAHGADDIAQDVLPAALTSARALDPKALRRPDGTIDVAVLSRASPAVTTAADRASSVQDEVRELPQDLLPTTVRDRRAEFVDQVEELASSLRSASDALTVAPSLLGADKPRRWFVLVQQTSESRGTGGLPGGYAILEARGGRLSVSSTGSNADLKSGRVDPVGLPRDYVERYNLDGAFDIWQNINLSPDLPVVARYVAQRWKAQTGQSVDGVITLDAVALQQMLQGSGPLQVTSTKTIRPDEVEAYLALGQYDIPGDDQRTRKEELTTVAKAVIDRFTKGGGDSESLLRGLTTAVRTGHVRIAAQDPSLAEVLRRSGGDGGLPRDGRPFVLPVVVNGAGGKLEYFLNRSATWTGGSCDGARRTTTLRLVLDTDPPPLDKLPSYVTIRLEGNQRKQTLTDRLGISVYATRGATLRAATLDGETLPLAPTAPVYVEVGAEAGLPVWRVYLDLEPRAPRTLELDLDEPVVKGEPQLLEQPLARPLQKSVTVPTCR